jgi:tetratricopeptide (TPR) repeat protein
MNELVEIAIVAYRAGRYKDAVELLLQVTDSEVSNYFARLYLAMAYEKCGRISEAHRLFKRLSEECPDKYIRQKAGNALPLVEAEMRLLFRRGKADGEHVAQEQDNLVWIANEKY